MALDFMRSITKLGEATWVQLDELRHASAVIRTVLYVSIQPRHWARTVRNLLARQVLAVGVEPLLFVCGVAVSTLCLTIVFILVALASGYLFGAWLGKGSRDVWFFSNTVLNALHPQDIVCILAKSVLPALFNSASCCIGGLGVGAVTDIP